MSPQLSVVGVAAVVCLMTIAGCGGGSSIEGMYESGMYKLEIMPAGKAKFFLGDDGPDCTYVRNENNNKSFTLNCLASDPREVVINDDGSLQVPMVGQMKKIK
jgi:hypothetical protein